MATKYYIKGLGFVEDNDKNHAFLVSIGKVDKPVVKVIKTKKKKNDTVDTGHAEPDHGDAERAEE